MRVRLAARERRFFARARGCGTFPSQWDAFVPHPGAIRDLAPLLAAVRRPHRAEHLRDSARLFLQRHLAEMLADVPAPAVRVAHLPVALAPERVGELAQDRGARPD